MRDGNSRRIILGVADVHWPLAYLLGKVTGDTRRIPSCLGQEIEASVIGIAYYSEKVFVILGDPVVVSREV